MRRSAPSSHQSSAMQMKYKQTTAHDAGEPEVDMPALLLRTASQSQMRAHFGKFVAYYRVSTDRQGQSGLGLQAQHEAVMNYLNGGPWTLVAEHTEVESGKRNARPELQKALAACRRHKAKLVIAKLDRLSRNL